MLTQLITEGITELKVPELEQFRTPAGDYAPSLTRVFYNPLMEPCRDISVSVVQVLARELGGVCVCDPLAGVGARGLRYAKEVKGVAKVVINDRSPEAAELIRKNVELNELAGFVEVHNQDANALLWSRGPRFQVIDIDPFGSPAPFIDAACAALLRQGMLMLTATDTAPLSGAYPKACVRRYGARPLRTEYCHELGIRILIAYCQRTAGKRELALIPLLSHATRHYFRIYLRARRGAREADEILSQQGYISHCFTCGRRVATQGTVPELPNRCKCGEKLTHAGPLWLGPLMDKGFIQRVVSDLALRNFKLCRQELELLNRCMGESEGPPAFYDVHDLSRRAGVHPPRLAGILDKLRGLGYFASRTHFSDLGLRTDAPLDELIASFR